MLWSLHVQVDRLDDHTYHDEDHETTGCFSSAAQTAMEEEAAREVQRQHRNEVLESLSARAAQAGARPGAQVHVRPHAPEALLKLANLCVHHHVGSTASPVAVSHMPVARADVAIVLARASGSTEPIRADAAAVSTLLVFEELREQAMRRNRWARAAATTALGRVATAADAPAGASSTPSVLSQASTIMQLAANGGPSPMSDCTIVCEVQDPRTQKIIERQSTKTDHIHYFRANKLVAALLAMVAQKESGGIREALVRLMRADAPNFALLPVGELLGSDSGLECSFHEMGALVREKVGGLIVGIHADGSMQVNPTDKGRRRAWKSADRLVILTSEAKR